MDQLATYRNHEAHENTIMMEPLDQVDMTTNALFDAFNAD